MASAAIGRGEVGSVVTFPQPATRMRSGVTVQVDARGVSANGYRTIRVKVSNTPTRNRPAVPVTADRRFRIVIKPWGRGHLANVVTSQIIEIPEKQSAAEAAIAIPFSGQWNSVEINVFESGSHLADVSGHVPWGMFGFGAAADTQPAVLLVDADVPGRDERLAIAGRVQANSGNPPKTYNLPDFSRLAAALGYSSNQGGAPGDLVPSDASRLPDPEVLWSAAQYPLISYQPPHELPRRWIELSCYDAVVISADDLALMSRQNKRELRALIDWLHTGPTLIVYGVKVKKAVKDEKEDEEEQDDKDDFARLAEVEKLLALPPLLSKEALASDPLRGWQIPNPSDATAIRAASTTQTYYGVATPAPVATPQKTKTDEKGDASAGANSNGQQPAPIVKSARPFVGRGAGLGWVIAMAAEDPSAPENDHWNWAFHSVPLDHDHWQGRHGMTYENFNHDFWNWHIPGVGAAPVFGFLALATLFAIVIGPVNYLMLGKIQRLYLLLITVPAGAAVVTFCLFAYAVLSDGLGVKARIRSYSLLDQASGQTVSWSRQSYYASLVPSQGITFADDVVAFPIVQAPHSNSYGSPVHRISWQEGGQQLEGGYISSRTLSQLMVVRACQTKARLTVAEPRAGEDLRATNQLGSQIKQLVVRDSAGNYFAPKGTLEPNAAGPLESLSAQAAEVMIKKVIEDNATDFPPNYNDEEERRLVETRWNGWWGGGNMFSPGLASSMLETELSALAGNIPTSSLKPGCYFAVVERNPDVPLGIEHAKELSSLHIIVGRWTNP